MKNGMIGNRCCIPLNRMEALHRLLRPQLVAFLLSAAAAVVDDAEFEYTLIRNALDGAELLLPEAGPYDVRVEEAQLLPNDLP
jgi:L-aminopeptidase/D-esterase-like protein